ncbi:mediator of RNA polymerase II transcription subunit 13 [Sarocladium implicatum]|nr:mediator of RNA polymerase II transcription subunit 13 [Sarocladium implicatum]
MDTSAYNTNTLLLNHVSSITFRVYEPRSDTSHNLPSVALEVESALRAKGHIVYYDSARGSLWYFHIRDKNETTENAAVTPTIEELSSPRFASIDQGSIDPATLYKGRTQNAAPDSASPTTSTNATSTDPSSRLPVLPKPHSPDQDMQMTSSLRSDSRTTPVPLSVAYENFMAGFLMTATSKLAAATGSTVVNYRTVLLRSSGTSSVEPPTLCSLKAHLTTAGSLTLSIRAQACNGLAPPHTSSSPTPVGCQILTAPFGLLAIDQAYLNLDGGSASLAATPATHALSTRGQADKHNNSWKLACAKALQLKGIDLSLLEDCSWTNIAFPRRPGDLSSAAASLLWPSPLCLRRRAVPVAATSRLDNDLLKGHEESHDPLGQAKLWFNSSHERDEKLALRRAERIAADARDHQEHAAGRVSRPNDAVVGLGLNRTGASAAGQMYPTPPDGVQQTTGATPALDAADTSPVNPPSATAGLDVDADMTSLPSDTKNNEAFGQDPSDTEEAIKRERSGSNMLESSDNMFGEMGADIFGEDEMNDITEDDFNFFDEVGEQSMTGPPDLTMADAQVEDAVVKQPSPVPEPSLAQPVEDTSGTMEAQAPSSPVFAKPELKHARSSLQDEASTRRNEEKPTSAKRERSPFNPDTVFKRVRASLSIPQDETGRSRRRSSVFGTVGFDPLVPLINKKYEHGGTFDFGNSIEPGKPGNHLTILASEQFKKRVKGVKRVKDPTGTLLRRFTALASSTAHPSPAKIDDSASDDDGSSQDSDSDHSSFTTEGPSSPMKASANTGRLDEEIASQVASVKDIEHDDEAEPSLPVDVPRLARPEKPELSVSRLFADPEPLALDLSMADDDLIHLAQVLTDQAATGALQVCDVISPQVTGPDLRAEEKHFASCALNAVDILRNAGIAGFENAIPSKLKDVLETQDALVTGQTSRLQPRPIPGRGPFNDMEVSNFYALPLPHLELKRADSKLSVLPTAVMFWESLGLAPISGAKNCLAACVFPSWKGVSDNVGTFLDRLKSMYELLRLGSFSNLKLSGEAGDGLVPYEVDRISTSPDATMTANGSSLIDAMEPLRLAVKEMGETDTNIVLYFVYSPNNPSSIIEACTAFHNFFEYYKKTLTSKRDVPRNELVLQLVSLDAMSSPTSLILKSSDSMMRLCIETYDRCTSFTQPMPAPAITLEQPIPRHVNFECSPKASASIIHENSAMHVAYARSVDDRWVSAAWTDDRGRVQATASFCLGRKGKALSTPMTDVAHEIWESTLDLISTWKVQWRIVIAKCGPMDEDEAKFWVDLARTQDKEKARVTLTLICVETEPSVQIFSAAAKLPQSAMLLGPTPVSTPQASVLSPDQVATPATPARETTSNNASNTPGGDPSTDPEPDSSLLNVTDQAWVALAGHRLNISPNATESQPALVSGYLLKRSGPGLDETPAMMEVNLVHADVSPRQYETSLREILSWYAALGTLARARGVVERDADIRPWHVAAAQKAVRALYLLL